MADIANQESVVQSLQSLFEHTTIIDRREQPSHGYRAVHVVVKYRGKLIEIQVRTALQQLWAELSEKFSDVSDPAIKYGGGEKRTQKVLMDSSLLIGEEELLETMLSGMSMSSQDKLTENEENEIFRLQEKLSSIRQEMSGRYTDSIKRLEKIKREKR